MITIVWYFFVAFIILSACKYELQVMIKVTAAAAAAAAAKLIVIIVLFSKAWPVTERRHVLGSAVLLFGNLFPFVPVRKNDTTAFVLDKYGLVPAAPQRQIQHGCGG